MQMRGRNGILLLLGERFEHLVNVLAQFELSHSQNVEQHVAVVNLQLQGRRREGGGSNLNELLIGQWNLHVSMLVIDYRLRIFAYALVVQVQLCYVENLARVSDFRTHSFELRKEVD